MLIVWWFVITVNDRIVAGAPINFGAPLTPCHYSNLPLFEPLPLLISEAMDPCPYYNNSTANPAKIPSQPAELHPHYEKSDEGIVIHERIENPRRAETKSRAKIVHNEVTNHRRSKPRR